ncbi:hypothetical protein GO281_04692 [Ralstonia solanacearum]|uniref:hypothetical protein n=1 Tax=Ralstonia pseudosolanacearum TaxID=1310165 RepID=UPI000E58E387|nr:hypothetical protein [Ralstonia pseudosolanacearum]AXW09566.1 hypothetical protein CJO83_03295 [Ralstonia solanacearum]AXW42161.1 hypothetical protein CJO90_03290 [Ralstonia solanacearum]AXW46866.1 hypothetical protein CJO91_03545 [Ralstonia solanacearum]AXW65471.1 hypothetical protein CJO95_03290 [Ralstonia solanacearum]NKA60909.1 hypothetical protein [Ralstonia solanacearum]
MRNQILSDPFPGRRDVVEALWTISKDETSNHDLKKIALDLDSLSLGFSSTAAANAYAALAGLVRIIDALAHWRVAVLEALPEADRFLRSARERYALWSTEYSEQPAASNLLVAAEAIPTLTSIAGVAPIARAVALTPLPLGVFEATKLPSWLPKRDKSDPPQEEAVDLTVAFLKFQVDGLPAVELQHLSPGVVHDLEIEVRVSRWPSEQGELKLTPISVEPKSTYDFPAFRFAKPAGEAPYVMHQRGRAVVHLPQGMHARPFEFKYTAEFLPEQEEQPVAVVGHRTLLIEGTDIANFQVCGYPPLDRKLFEIRDTLRRRGGVAQEETADALLLLGPLCNLAGRAVQDAEFQGRWSEADFQTSVRSELRRNPLIGSHLDEHAHGGGGITDLSLRGLPIELKAQDSLITNVDECEKYFAQTASYAVAKGKRTAILCVLDSSPKSTAPRTLDSLLNLRVHDDSGVAICVLVVQGNLAKPSALSR